MKARKEYKIYCNQATCFLVEQIHVNTEPKQIIKQRVLKKKQSPSFSVKTPQKHIKIRFLSGLHFFYMYKIKLKVQFKVAYKYPMHAQNREKDFHQKRFT